MRDFIGRIIHWNHQRYNQDFDHSLTFKLLDEELAEFNDAETDVDKLDALVDIVYVAIGAMWKLGLTKWHINEAIQVVCDANDSKTVRKTAAHLKANIYKGDFFVPPEPALQEILDDCKR